MYRSTQQRIRDRFSALIRSEFKTAVPELKLEIPPKVSLGEIALPVAFDLAKSLKRPPRAVAQELVQKIGPLEGIERMEVAGAGYINVYLQRNLYFQQMMDWNPAAGSSATEGSKVIVEHTNINPNKAAHIGHLRNAVLGDSFVRMMRSLGRSVEVQN